MLGFRDRPAYEQFVAAAMGCGLGDVVARIEAGYCDDTPANGVRWLVRYPAEVERPPGKKIVLARRPKRPEEMKTEANKVKILIEMPAFSIVAPTNGTVHPSGKPYVRRNGDFVSIASYTAGERDALMEVARSFDAMPRIEAEPKPDKRAQGGTRPGDDFNAKAAWSDILPGWTNVRTRSDGTTEWRRPGKKLGISATTNFTGSDRLHVFTSSTKFEAEKSYTKFGAFAVLNYRGDFKAAARALGKEGYGSKTADDTSTRGLDGGGSWRVPPHCRRHPMAATHEGRRLLAVTNELPRTHHLRHHPG
jgi:putative DNA primase/helicase